MGRLLKKEFTLCMHPTVPIMLLLSAMVFIPNYPYSVIFFYVSLSIFFTSLTGRENNDIVYSMLLPVAKRDVVKARFVFILLVEAAQLLFLTGFVLLKSRVSPGANQAGMDANTALFALGLVDYAIFNLVFLWGYYKDVSKVGSSFVKASIAVFAAVIAEIVSTYALPFVRLKLDTPDPQFMPEKLAVLSGAALIFAALSIFTYKHSVKSFEKQDIQ